MNGRKVSLHILTYSRHSINVLMFLCGHQLRIAVFGGQLCGWHPPLGHRCAPSGSVLGSGAMEGGSHEGKAEHVGDASSYDCRVSFARSCAGVLRLSPTRGSTGWHLSWASGLVWVGGTLWCPHMRPSHTCSPDDAKKQGSHHTHTEDPGQKSPMVVGGDATLALAPRPGLSAAMMTAGPITLQRHFLARTPRG